MEKKQYAQRLIDYLYDAPTPFQSVACLKKLLDGIDAVELDEADCWDLKAGQVYYFIKDGTQIAAFKPGTVSLADNGFRIVVAHHDSPGFRIKPNCSTIDSGYERLEVEGYGGLIVHGWLDRPLGVAGRLCVRTPDGVKAVDINIAEPLLIIPSAAIHYVRDVNDGAKFNLQTEINPIFCQADETNPQKGFLDYIAARAGVEAKDILSFELSPYEYQKGCFVGANEEFISSPRMDDAAMAFSAFLGFTEAAAAGQTAIAIAYDHEEIGSTSTRGARSNTLHMIIDRLSEKLALSAEDRYRALANSFLFSADMSHATHPAYTGKTDPNHPVSLNKGPVLKLTYRQSYATSTRGSAAFKWLCEKNGLPYQVFTNRSDERGGGTIGPGLAAEFGITTVDIGNPSLAMHAVREFAGTDDPYYMTELMRALFESDLHGALCD